MDEEEKKRRQAEYKRRWYEANKEKKAEIDKKWKADNKEKNAEINKKWREDNRDSQVYKDKTNAYFRKRREDASNRLVANMRNRVWGALKGRVKKDRTMKLVGCTPEFLMKYLEKRFKPGMTWENQGEWHVDHIKPCASFDLTKESEQRKCFHYTNLQPLWGRENILKGDRY